MLDLMLGQASRDVLLEGGDVVLSNGAERVAQQIGIRLRNIKGGWLLDVEAGLPYPDEILIKNPDLARIRSLLWDEIAGVDGVTRIEVLELDYSASARSLRVTFDVISDYGRIYRSEYLNG